MKVYPLSTTDAALLQSTADHVKDLKNALDTAQREHGKLRYKLLATYFPKEDTSQITFSDDWAYFLRPY
jgi:hypothetical protein